MARFPSGQRGRTVNPLSQTSKVRILLSPPEKCAGIAQLARAAAFQAAGCGFETRFPLQMNEIEAGVAQLVEQLICNQQVTGSSPVASSIK